MWYTFEKSKIKVSCSDRELAEFLEKVITFRTRAVQDNKNATTDAGIVSYIIILLSLLALSNHPTIYIIDSADL